MHFLTFESEGTHRLGLLSPSGDLVIDVAAAAASVGVLDAPASMLEAIRREAQTVALAQRLTADVGALPSSATRPLGEVVVVAPIPRPAKNVFAVGLNYVRHNKEFTGSDVLPKDPIVFTKPPTTVVGPGDVIPLRPDLSPQIDYEGELAVVIGKGGRDIPEAEAHAHVFGYTIINDVTARDLQKRTSQWFLGKSLDGFGPMGPYLVHASAFSWPIATGIRTFVNGEVRQDSNTELLYFGVAKLIATISAGITLEPGDIIATGTPEGVGMGFTPPKYLNDGDVVEVEIDGIGRLTNPVRVVR